jgi:hypothetical protein
VTAPDHRDTLDIAPGQFAGDWIPQGKDTTLRGGHHTALLTPEACSTFGDDMLADVLAIKQELIRILRLSVNPGDDPSKAIGQVPLKAVLAGHSSLSGCDLQQLRCSAGAGSDILSKHVFSTLPRTALDAVMLTHAESALLDLATSHIAKCTSSIQALEHGHWRSYRWEGRRWNDDDFTDVRRSLGTESPWRHGGSITQGHYATAEVVLGEHNWTAENIRTAITKSGITRQ